MKTKNLSRSSYYLLLRCEIVEIFMEHVTKINVEMDENQEEED